MKNLSLILALLLLATPVFSAEDDITVEEIRADVSAFALDTIKILRFTETAVVTWRKVDADGNAVGEEFDVTFTNTPDDLETPEDETNTDFTDFYNYLHTRIRAGDSLKLAVQKACKIKLGL